MRKRRNLSFLIACAMLLTAMLPAPLQVSAAEPQDQENSTVEGVQKILINGKPLEGFDSEKTDYEVELLQDVKPNVTLVDESGMWIQSDDTVKQAENANGTATVQMNDKTYNIQFHTDETEEEYVYLSDMLYKVEKLSGAPDDALTVMKDKSRNTHGGERPLDIFSQTYEKGLGLHGGAKLTFSLDGQYTRFVGAIGASPALHNISWAPAGVMQAKVYLDGEEVESLDLDFRYGEKMKVLDLDLEGKETLTFEVHNLNDNWTDDYFAIADAKLYGQGAPVTPENIQILFDGQEREDFTFDVNTKEYKVYLPEGTKDAPDVSVVDKTTGEPVAAQIKQAGADKVIYEGKEMESIGEVPDSAVLNIQGLPDSYRIRFMEDGDWRNISGEVYDYTDTWEMREEPIHDYSQTLTMKVFCAKPDSDTTESQVAYRFDEVLDLIKKVDKLTYGVPKIIYLVGWQYTGHDTGYPSWDIVNEDLKCKNCNHKDATECLSSLMLEAKEKYNTTVSLHINSVEGGKGSPLWDRYVENDLVSKKNGSLRATSEWGGEMKYKLNYKNEWDYGFYKARVDRLCEMLPIQEMGTIHSDAYWAEASDQSTLSEEQTARRQMVRYWRSLGVDLTTEMLWTTRENGQDEYGYNPGMTSEKLVDTYLGDIPMVWHYGQPIEEFMKIPATLMAGGRVNSHSSYTADADAIRTLIGESMHGEDLFTNYDANPVYARPESEWVPQFISQFCQQTVPYFYLNQFDREELSGQGDERKVQFSDGVETAIEDKKLTHNGVTLRENGNIFIPISWKDNTIIAFSENGYTGHEWTFPEDWTSDAEAVDIYTITKNGWSIMDASKEIKDGKITLSLDANQAVVIVPEGSSMEYIPGEFSLTSPKDEEDVLIDSDTEFTWEEAKDAGNYKFVVAKDADFQDIVYEKSTTETKVSLADFKDKLEKDSKYYWKVFASVQKDSTEGLWSSGDAFTFYTDATEEPAVPAEFTVKVTSDNQAELTWKDTSDGLNAFELYRKEKTDPDNKYQLLDTIRGTEYVDTNEFNSTKAYSYKLVAKNSMGTSDPVYVETNPLKWIEAEDADEMSSGLQVKNNDSGKIVGNSDDGATLLYKDVDFGDIAPNKISVRYSGGESCTEDSRIEIRLDGSDGELVATVATPPTGDWNNYTVITEELDSAAGEKLKGVHTICLVLRGSGSDVGDYNWFSFEQVSETAETDKSELQKLYDSVEDLEQGGYTKETWDVFKKARSNAKTVLEDTEASQEEVNTAKEELQSALDGLRVDKTTLKYFLDAAEKYVENGDVADTIESVQKLFEEAIREGKAVMEKENPTMKEVDSATTKLIRAINALDMRPGDKAALEMLVKQADMINLDKYVEKGQDEFLAALDEAKAVLDDGDAMTEEVETAWKTLADAMGVLRLKADKEALEDLLEEVGKLDLSKYTEESVAVLREAIEYAETILADETLSEDDQKKVDEATEALKEAKDALVVKTEADGHTPAQDSGQNAGSGKDSGSGNNQTVKTGDTAPIGVAVGLAGLSLFAILAVIIMKRKRG